MKKKQKAPNMKYVKQLARIIVKHALDNSRSDKTEKTFPNWYAGITNDPNIREVGHKQKAKVDELPTFRPHYARSYANARATETYLCEKHGFSHCKAKGGANDDTHRSPSNYVYAYLLPPELR